MGLATTLTIFTFSLANAGGGVPGFQGGGVPGASQVQASGAPQVHASGVPGNPVRKKELTRIESNIMGRNFKPGHIFMWPTSRRL